MGVPLGARQYVGKSAVLVNAEQNDEMVNGNSPRMFKDIGASKQCVLEPADIWYNSSHETSVTQNYEAAFPGHKRFVCL